MKYFKIFTPANHIKIENMLKQKMKKYKPKKYPKTYNKSIEQSQL